MTADRALAPEPYVFTNPVRREILDREVPAEVAGEVIARCGHVLQIAFGFQRTVQVVPAFRHVPPEHGPQGERQSRAAGRGRLLLLDAKLEDRFGFANG